MDLMMVDFLSFPLFVKWYITSKCNIRCKHCYLTDYTEQPDLADILPILKYLKNKSVDRIMFLGGEPLVRNDLEIVVSKCTDLGIGTSIATNGILLSKERATSLVECGCKAFQVSLEGHIPELSDSVRGQGTFSKIVSGALNAKNAGARLILAFTVTKRNVDSIANIYEFASDLGADELRLLPFIPLGSCKDSYEEFRLNRSGVLHVRKTLSKLQTASSRLYINSIFVSPQSDEKNDCSSCSKSMGCGAATHTLVINSDLTLSPCDLLVEEDKTGSAINQPASIEDLWLNSPVFKKWRGEVPGRTVSISSFADVHNHGCHLAHMVYKDDIFRE